MDLMCFPFGRQHPFDSGTLEELMKSMVANKMYLFDTFNDSLDKESYLI